MYRLIFWTLLLMTSSANAAWLHLCPASPASRELHTPVTQLATSLLTRPDGTQARFIINEQSVIAGCRSLPLPVSQAQVEALHPVPATAMPEDVILLQGTTRADRFAISGTTFLPARPAPARPVPMPLHVNLLPMMQARAFGAEERVHVQLTNGQLDMSCSPGSRPAGVLLSGPLYLPRADIAIQAEFSGSGNFEWQVADASHAAREAALPMGHLAAQGNVQQSRLALPRALERETWKQFVLVCPPRQAKLRLGALQLATGKVESPPRAAWVWQPPAWQQQAERLLDWAQQLGMGELFIAVPVESGAVRDAAALAAFIRQASGRGIAVWSVDGDPHMVLPAEQKNTVRRARAYAAYNAAVPATARLRGMQFDIEPYLLPGYETAAAEWDRRYLDLARALRQSAGTMQLEFVVPYWWAGKTALLQALAPFTDSLAVMDYRTDAQEIYRFAVPFLDWADTYGKRARIALEAGTIAAEIQRRYARVERNAPGELHLLRFDGMSVLLLLKEARALPDAQSYRLQNTAVLDGSATSFHAGRDKLMQLLPRLERDFAAWPEFSGIALHEFPGQPATPK